MTVKIITLGCKVNQYESQAMLEALLAALKQAGAVQIATGSYVGTGTYGADHPCSLTFDFVPKEVIIQEANEN